ncbi:YvrJ family protein [Bacillus velezensis]|nr:YvrJ [Bacillus sp. 5B6]QAR58217.1 YvrJ family protein [Bacillus velezensis]
MTAGQVRRWLIMDQVFIEETVRQIGNLGFPALIAMYLLTRFEKKFDALIELMTELKDQKMKN